ncbi:peptidylprolyl isomerase fpr4 [Mortierella claussenii]|nr:peptidylprolyl isomerase fpr4 [Mortierella claussenii]
MILGFWGLTVFPNKTYTQIVDNSFKLSMAALDEEAKPGRSSIRVAVDKKTFILCSLIAGQVEQQNLDLVFTEGEEITFSVSGDNAVHLSGNYLPGDEGMDYSDEDMYGMEDEDDEDAEDDEDEDGEEGNVIVTKGAKRVADFVGDEDDDEDSEEDPDFTGEDDEDEDDDDSDDDDDDDMLAGGIDDDDEDDEEEEEDDEEEVEAPVIQKQEPVKKQELAATPAKKQKVSEEKAVPAKGKEEAKKKDNIKTLPNGLIIEDVKIGDGARAKAGKKIGMRYIGRLTDGKVFDKNTGGKPFTFKLGAGEVIKGWDIGIQGMQVNGERRLTIPPALAYGAQGAPPDIPRNATLVFEVKLVNLK